MRHEALMDQLVDDGFSDGGTLLGAEVYLVVINSKLKKVICLLSHLIYTWFTLGCLGGSYRDLGKGDSWILGASSS